MIIMLEKDKKFYLAQKRARGTLLRDILITDLSPIYEMNRCAFLLHSRLEMEKGVEYNPQKELGTKLSNSTLLPKQRIEENFSGIIRYLTDGRVILAPHIDNHPENFLMTEWGTVVRLDLEKRGMTNLHYDRARVWQGEHKLDLDVLQETGEAYVRGYTRKKRRSGLTMNKGFVLRDLSAIVMKAIGNFSFSEPFKVKHLTSLGFLDNAILSLQFMQEPQYTSEFTAEQNKQNRTLLGHLIRFRKDLVETNPTYSHSL